MVIMSPTTDQSKLANDELVSAGVGISADGSIPVIDMEELQGPHHSQFIQQIAHACEHYGAFMVKNHGIPETEIYNFLDATLDFFKLPEDERMKFFTTEPHQPVELSPGYKVQNVRVLRESLRFLAYPVEDYVHLWPSNPPSFRKSVIEYCTSVKRVELALGEAICESLGVGRDYIDKKLLSEHVQRVAMNLYPTSQQEDPSEVVYGIRGHTDPSIITILLQNNVHGLQVLHDGKWMDVNPSPNDLVVLSGDLMQVLSNHRYKSLLHQVLVSCDKERISIATSRYPSNDTIIGPAKELINNDHPAVYKNFTYQEFRDEIYRARCLDDARLNVFKVSAVA